MPVLDLCAVWALSCSQMSAMPVSFCHCHRMGFGVCPTRLFPHLWGGGILLVIQAALLGFLFPRHPQSLESIRPMHRVRALHSAMGCGTGPWGPLNGVWVRGTPQLAAGIKEGAWGTFPEVVLLGMSTRCILQARWVCGFVLGACHPL